MTTDEPVANLVRRAQTGDRDAFGLLVERYRARLTRQIEARMGENVRSRLQVDDVLQETIASALESIGRFRWRGENSFYSWLGSIAENIIRHAAEKKSWGQLRLTVDLPGEHESPGTKLRRHERFDRLETAINGLSADQKTALTLARFEGLKVREIAERMNRSPKAVYKLLARAVLELRKDVGDTRSLHLPDRLLEVEEAPDEQ